MMTRYALSTATVLLFAAHGAAQCTVDLGPDTVTIYFGYDPMACTTLQPAMSGPAPYAFQWSNGASTAAITVCDTASSWYFVNVIDGDTCLAGDSVFVNVVDVRCGNNNHKVLVCHIPPGSPANAHTICISENGVPAHLAHGCVLGSCAPDTAQVQVVGGTLQMALAPNPMADATQITITSTEDQEIDLALFDAGGRRVMQVYQGTIAAGETRTFPLAGKAVGATSHMVWMHLRGSSGDRVQQALMLER